jgi:hypothetical protein
MMALSARFSTLSYFDGINLKERGINFARKAQTIYYDTAQGTERHMPSLVWLQGCILLAFYNQSCRPALGCDLMIATCTRSAYSLGLHRIDEEEHSPENSSRLPSDAEWILKEEQRRAWWSIWELDAFDSIASRRPFSINQTRMCVSLPVSDEAWFAGTPIKSPILDPNILQCWKALRESPNQDERAWFLVSNYITAHALELFQHGHVPKSNISDIETVISCFSLLLHEKFRESFNQLIYSEATYVKCNWLLLTRLMVQGYYP